MKIIAVRNAKIHPQFQPTVHLAFDPVTSDLSVSLYLPSLATEEAATGVAGLTLIESVVVNIGDLRKRYDWCDHQTYFVAVHAGAFLPVFALYPETLPNRETAVTTPSASREICWWASTCHLQTPMTMSCSSR